MRRVWQTIRAVVGVKGFHDDLAEEMRLHLELRTRKLEEKGLSEGEAQVAARRRFGSSLRAQEEAREAWGVRWLDDLRQDAVYAWRSLSANRIFSAAAILTLTVGIAANTALFAFIDALILRPLAVPQPEQLAMVVVKDQNEGSKFNAISYPLFRAIEKRTTKLEGLFARSATQFLFGTGVDAHQISAASASGNYYGTLGVQPALGRFFTPADDRAGAPPVAVLSYTGWQHYFGGATRVLGQTLHLNGHAFSVIGVEPQTFPNLLPGTTTELTIPIHAEAALHPQFHMLEMADIFYLSAYGRVRADSTLPEANAELATLTKPIVEGVRLQMDSMDFWGMQKAGRRSLGVASGAHGNRLVTEKYDKPLLVLICISVLVLGIGCLNVANLLLARAIARQRELSVRLAIGASQRRVVRQLMTESLLLALISAGFGAVLASWFTSAASRLLPVQASADWRVVGFLAVLSILVTLLFGILPAFRGVAFGLEALKLAYVGGQGRSGARLSRTIVMAQVAFSVLLICSAFLFEKSFRTLENENVGFDRSHLVFSGIYAGSSGMNAAQTTQYLSELLGKVQSAPGVSGAAITNTVPLTGAFMWYMMSAKQYPQLRPEQLRLFGHYVSPGYFRTLKIPLLAGRDLEASDSNARPAAGILSERAAAIYFPGRLPIGETLEVEGSRIRIVGVVKDARDQDIRIPAPQILYTSFENGQTETANGIAWNLLVRTNLPTGEVATVMRQIVQKMGRNVSLIPPVSLDQAVDSSIATDRLLTMVATGFAVLGGLLAIVGLYGVVAYSVAQRTKEIGIRLALGAKRSKVVWGILQEALLLAGIGIAAGIALGLLSGKLIASLLYQTQASDAASFAYTALVIAFVAVTAVLFPAISASRIDPVVALRYE